MLALDIDREFEKIDVELQSTVDGGNAAMLVDFDD
jgi:hypothetical protein